MTSLTTGAPPALSWTKADPERRLGFRGRRYTRVSSWCSLLGALLLTVGFYAVLYPLQETYFAVTFMQRGPIPYVIAFFFFWSVAILGIKFLKLRLQRRALALDLLPDDPEFVLSPLTVDDVNDKMLALADDSRHFVLMNRIAIALSNLRNLGRVGDVDEILKTQAEHDESAMETSYSLLQGFVWAIPVLGFIGTVQGLSVAIGGFGSVLATTEELSQIKEALQGVTGGLAIAFETTMQGLVAALLVQLALIALKKNEEEFLDACSEYCVRHIVGRLRLIPFEEGRGE